MNICLLKWVFLLDSLIINDNWIIGMGFCKENGMYLVGNFNLLNVILVCFGYNYISLCWIGVFRENYLNID